MEKEVKTIERERDELTDSNNQQSLDEEDFSDTRDKSFYFEENKKYKKENGQFFTIYNPFFVSPFYEWFESIPESKREVILEPFAGSNNIVKLINELSVGGEKEKLFKSFDIDLSYENKYPSCPIEYRDTIKEYPKGFFVAITNPPYLAKNSATRSGIAFPETKYDDLYKICLEKMLLNNEYVGAIIPESFITSGLFLNRLYYAISLTCKMFDDTECPVCLALFVPENEKEKKMKKDDFIVYRMNKKIGSFIEIKKASERVLKCEKRNDWIFNCKNGEIGIKCVDGTKKPTIEFIQGNEIEPNKIKVSSRSLTRVKGLPENVNKGKFIKKCNEVLEEYRKVTNDICLTSFKGLRDDNEYRRRLDFKTAKEVMDAALYRVLQDE